ncbi:gibberellin 3-oxidase, partial [Genlisea aurea]
DLNSLTELPETHSWFPAAAAVDDDVGFTQNVPVVDLNHENAARLVGHACTTWGVFQLVNHPVPRRLTDEIESAADRLFSLPMQRKLRAARGPDAISGYGTARISRFFPKRMWSEGFTVWGSPRDNAQLLWPNDHHRFCETIEKYERAMKNLAGELMRLMLGGMGVRREAKWGSGSEPGSALQLNCYPPCPDPDRAMGLAAHTDSTLLTILHQSGGACGLQVLRGDRWVTMPPIPGALVVHVGDLMHILSNGLYPSVLHRAVVNRNRRRVSVAYLYGPPANVKIGPLDELIDERHPALYREVSWKEYLGTKAQHFDKALSSVR